MKSLYDSVSYDISRKLTRQYSTSFSLGIGMLGKKIRQPVYAVYGFVRLADEIVDSFHDYDQETLLARFRAETEKALSEKISLNPVLNSFQNAVHTYGIDNELIDTFLASMEMDLDDVVYDRKTFNTYVLGSAEVVGLMCLWIFCDGNRQLYHKLRPYAMKLGAAYQKINFLRDLRADFNDLGRAYFPCIDITQFSEQDKKSIESEIEKDFRAGLKGIRMLPAAARFGVYLSYIYYYNLFKKIRKTPANQILKQRIRISNARKYFLLLNSYLMYKVTISNT